MANQRTKRLRRQLQREREPDRAPLDKRSRIYKRDGYACVYCGSRRQLTLDHIQPRSKGGFGEEWNLLTACRTCNGKRGDLGIARWLRVCLDVGLTPSVTLQTIAALKPQSAPAPELCPMHQRQLPCKWCAHSSFF